MGKSLANATQEERLYMSTKLQRTLFELLAHQNGMQNPSVLMKYKGKEIEKC